MKYLFVIRRKKHKARLLDDEKNTLTHCQRSKNSKTCKTTVSNNKMEGQDNHEIDIGIVSDGIKGSF